MKSSDWKGALVSLAAHAAALTALVWVTPSLGPEPLAARPAHSGGRGTAVATRVALLGRASTVRVESPTGATTVAPVIVRNRGPTRRQPRGLETVAPEGTPELESDPGASTTAGPAAVGGGADSEDGDGLAGVLANSADALSGDARAAAAAESLARQALAAPVPAKDLSRLTAKLQAAAARCYPPSAQRFHRAGVAKVEFCLDVHGALIRSAVLESSGFTPLDEAATGCVLPGALPAGPEVGAGCFTLPVRFGTAP